MASDYTRGEMEITDQSQTFSGFIRTSIWFGGHTALGVLLLTLIFAVGMGWMVALMITFVAGVVMGLALQMKMAWYLFLVGASILIGITGLIAGLFGAMLG
tara:strand:+ start:886 stop:1188 length:303 start_codon:yes stop_codon:yes gene_type:complete